MDRYKVSVSGHWLGKNGARIENDMEVEVQSFGSPLANEKGRNDINNAFKAKYGVDLKESDLMKNTFLRATKK